MKEIQTGDRVRLKIRYSGNMNMNRRSYKGVDWSRRKGTVVKIGVFNQSATILWDGRKSVDQWPIGALEKLT
jgi:hypothetical protein